MKGRSAPLTMALELVSGLPVSTQLDQRRLMCRMRIGGQMERRQEWMEGDKQAGKQVKISRTQWKQTVVRTLMLCSHKISLNVCGFCCCV